MCNERKHFSHNAEMNSKSYFILYSYSYYTHPVDEDGLSKLDHLEGDLEADWDEIVVEDDEGESVEGKAHAVSVCKHKQRTQHCLALNLSS